jgi:hypothetical protein
MKATRWPITRLGDRIRIGGMAEISGFTMDLPPARRARWNIPPDAVPRRGRFSPPPSGAACAR